LIQKIRMIKNMPSKKHTKQFKNKCLVDILSDDFNNFIQDYMLSVNQEEPFYVPFEDIIKLYIKHREQRVLSNLFH